MLSIENILREQYPIEDAKLAMDKIRELNFYAHLTACINLVNGKLKHESEEIEMHGCIQLGALASGLLMGVNEQLRELKRVKGSEIVKEMEPILGGVSKELFLHVVKNSKSNKGMLLTQLSVALHDTSEIFQYDEQAVLRVSGFRDVRILAESLLNSEAIAASSGDDELSFYVWKGKKEHKNDFINLFMGKKLILHNKKKNLHKLFDKSAKKLQIEFDPKKAELIMTLFYHAKKDNLLGVTTKNGFYHPLKCHALDFHKNILKGKKPGEFNDYLIKSKAKWAENSGKVGKWILEFKEI
jgi:hypothetical protein